MNPELILSFNGMVTIAVRIVTEKYPHAKLYEADGVASGGPTTDPNRVDRMRVVFQNPGNTTVIIKSTVWGEFAPPVLLNEPFLEDVVIDWPIKMDLPLANELKMKAGYTSPFTTVTLRNPLGPVRTNPFFIFGGGTGTYVFVDTVTGQVTTGS
jgi:hypothetical protein